MKLLTRVLVAVVILSGARVVSAQVPAFRHVFVIVLENHEYGDIIGSADAPYFNSLASRYGLATNAFALVHPSLPNYMALTGGDTFFTTNCTGCLTSATNIADQIEAKGKTWMAYMEDMPAACLTTDSGLYVARHNPFVHYSTITSDGPRCASHVVPFSRFSSDLSSGLLADYVWITPNLCNDMHDCGIASGDAWLASVVPQIITSSAFTDSVLFITFDEGTSDAGGGGHIPLVVVSPLTAPGTRSATTVTHYSLLRTIEDAWGLAPLGQSASATAMTAFFPQPSTAPSEVVLYGVDASKLVGWSKVADSTAAAGTKLSTPDAGAAAVSNALANPSSYFEATFQALAGTRYRVWLRIHAQGDSKWNDSVFVQFSDSVDAEGAPAYRIGTTNGYTVNLWSCATCQSFGWGWQRNAYWLPDSGDVWFPATGTHTIRVQTREDGVEIDQIVISAARYATSPPGPTSADSTIVPKPSDSTPPPVAPTPFSGSPTSIPGVIRASDFDNGGEGVAYHDTTPGNAGGAYRDTNVDLEASTNGGFNVGWISPGEWLAYTVNVASAGTYTATFRIASAGQGGTFHFEVNGVNVTGPMVIQDTGGWQSWQTIIRSVSLAAGVQLARLVFDGASSGGIVGNIYSVTLATGSAPSSPSPFTGTPIALPGTVEAENFDNGGEGVAYHDLSAGNEGGAYRSTDVDLEPASSGGYDVGWVAAGEWLKYTVNVTTAATYTVTFRVAASGQGGKFHLEMNGVNVTGTLTIPDTGGWQAWRTLSVPASLQAGVQVARLVMDADGANAVGNFDSIQFTRP